MKLKISKEDEINKLIRLPLLKIYEIVHVLFKVYSVKKLYNLSLQILIMQFLSKVKLLSKKLNPY